MKHAVGYLLDEDEEYDYEDDLDLGGDILYDNEDYYAEYYDDDEEDWF